MAVVPILFFALGAITASFVGVLAARLSTGQSYLVGRSRCDACGVPLTPLTMVPILSYFMMGGNAQCCGTRLSLISPLAELILGGLFVYTYIRFGLSLALLGMLLSLALLLALVLYDIAHQILPSSLLIAFVVSSAVTGFFLAPSLDEWYTSVFVAVGIATSLALIHFFSRGRMMGFADIPFAFGLSLLVGPAAFPGFLFSFWIGAALGIVVLLERPAGSRMGVEVPFAPFLAAGFLLAFATQWNPFIFVAAMS